MSDREAYDLETLLLQLREMVDSARTMPMSASVLVNRDEALDLLDEALQVLPEELRHARWLLKEREEYLAQARRDAEDIVEEARVQAERMVERTEVAREARRVAQQVVAHAEADSRRIRHEAEDYIDHNPNGASGRAGARAWLAGFEDRPTETAIGSDLVAMIAEGDLVVQVRKLELKNPRRAGESYTTTQMDMFRIADGRIAEHWDASVKPGTVVEEMGAECTE